MICGWRVGGGGFVIALLTMIGELGAQGIRYDEVRPEHRARATREPCALPTDLRTKSIYVLRSPRGSWTATVHETDPVVVPYDRARACIQLRHENGNVRGVTVGGFRTLRLEWINDKLLYLSTDVGHIAAVGQLLDVEDVAWIYARTEYEVRSYAPSVDALLRSIPASVPGLSLALMQRWDRSVTALYDPPGDSANSVRARLMQIRVESYDTEEEAEAGRRQSVNLISVWPTRSDTVGGIARQWWDERQVMARVGRHVVTVSSLRDSAVALVPRVFDVLAAELGRMPRD